MTPISNTTNNFTAAQGGAKELNSFCAQQMVDIMLSNSSDEEDGLFGSGFGGEIFSSFLSEALGKSIVEGGSFKGMEDLLVQDLTHVQMTEGGL